MIDSSSDFCRLDSKLFKAFVSAARLLNFTAAAKAAGMTQSGVSQHIARLEGQLGVPLFKRINKKVYLTSAGELLRKFCEAQKEAEEELLEQIKNDQVCGKVRYAMPYSCLFAPHLAGLLREKTELGNIELSIALCHNDAIFEKLLGREIDFGFVTRRENNPAFAFEQFCREEYILVGDGSAGLENAAVKNIAELKLVDYPGMQVLFDIWMRHHFGSRAPAFSSFRTGASIDALPGAVTMIQHGIGVTVMPKHCVAKQLSDGSLLELPGPNKSRLLNDISIVTLKGAPLPAKVMLVMSLLKAAVHSSR